MAQSNFLSSIPNNKLEPVFLGGGSGSVAKSSGTYVPAFLRNQQAQDTSKTDTLTHTKAFQMTDNDFPSLLGTKSSTKSKETFTHYSNALKKDIDKPKPKVSVANRSNGTATKNTEVQSILDDYEDDYTSDDGY
jgi:hypothetical protein